MPIEDCCARIDAALLEVTKVYGGNARTRAVKAAALDLALAAFDRGHGVAGNLFLKERARLAALRATEGEPHPHEWH